MADITASYLDTWTKMGVNRNKLVKIKWGGETHYYFSDKTDSGGGYSHETMNLMEVAKSATSGALGAFKTLSEIAGGGSYVPKYGNIPMWTGTKWDDDKFSIKLNFYWGSHLKFDAYEEVILPMMRLAAYYGLVQKSGSLYNGPAPNKNQVLVSIISSIGGMITAAANEKNAEARKKAQADKEKQERQQKEQEEGKSSSELEYEKVNASPSYYIAIQEKINKLSQTFYSCVDSVAESIIGSGYKLMTVYTAGSVYYGCLPVGMSWKFDKSNLDENGFPCTGEVEIKLVKLLSPTSGAITSAFASRDDNKSW